MANAGTSGYGATLKLSKASATLTVGQITKVGWSPGGITDIDISTMSGDNKWKEFIPGMIEAGEFSCDINLEDSQVTACMAIVGVTGYTAVVQFNDGTAQTTSSKFSVGGYLKPFGFEAPMDGAPVSQTLTIKLTGIPTFTAHS
jgi:hypothetical protein